jgi:hypothetical protein
MHIHTLVHATASFLGVTDCSSPAACEQYCTDMLQIPPAATYTFMPTQVLTVVSKTARSQAAATAAATAAVSSLRCLAMLPLAAQLQRKHVVAAHQQQLPE